MPCTPQRPHSIRVLVERFCAKYGGKPRIEYEINGVNSSKGLVDKRIGVTIIAYAGLTEDMVESAQPVSDARFQDKRGATGNGRCTGNCDSGSQSVACFKRSAGSKAS